METGKVRCLQSNEQEVLAQVRQHIGKAQVSGRRIECAAPWLVRKSLREEHDGN